MKASAAQVPTAALALVRIDVPDPVREPEARLRALVEEITALDAEVEQLSADLTAFSARYEHALGAEFAELELHERLVRRLQTLQDETTRLISELKNPSPPARKPNERKKRKRSASARDARGEEARGPRWIPGGALDDEAAEGDEPVAATPDLESEELTVKRLFRTLARLLHPDLARSDEERSRLHALMSQVNVAYEASDRGTLELILARVDRGDLLDAGVTVEEKLAYLETRLSALNEVRRSLLRYRQQLQLTSTFKLLAEWKRRQGEGRDYFSETSSELKEDAQRALEDAFTRMARLDRAARELTAVNHSMTKASADNLGGVEDRRQLRRFDPILESPLVRQGLSRLERRRASTEARELAHALEEAAEKAPWEAALVLMAFFAEIGGGPPDALAIAAGWRERFDWICREWDGSPSFEKLLVRLPAPLELGLRNHDGKIRFGVQLRSTDLLAGVPIALERKSVAAIARRVLSAIGPAETCKSCSEHVFLVHLMRTRGLDELNGLVCPECGQVAKSYFLFNWTEGQEALCPYALSTGLIDEAVMTLGGTGIAFQLLASKRAELTIGELKRLFFELYVNPYGIKLSPDELVVESGTRALDDDETAPVSAMTLRFVGGTERNEGPANEKELVALLKSRIERRFRPTGSPG